MKRVVYFDLDNTLYNSGLAIEGVFDWYSIDEQTDYSFSKIWGDDRSRAILDLFSQPKFSEDMDLLPSSVDWIQAVVDSGATVKFISRVPESVKEVRFKKLSNDFGHIIPGGVIDFQVWSSSLDFEELKRGFDDFIIVDDCPDNLYKYKANGFRCFVVNHLYNQHVRGDGFEVAIHGK